MKRWIRDAVYILPLAAFGIGILQYGNSELSKTREKEQTRINSAIIDITDMIKNKNVSLGRLEYDITMLSDYTVKAKYQYLLETMYLVCMNDIDFLTEDGVAIATNIELNVAGYLEYIAANERSIKANALCDKIASSIEIFSEANQNIVGLLKFDRDDGSVSLLALTSDEAEKRIRAIEFNNMIKLFAINYKLLASNNAIARQILRYPDRIGYYNKSLKEYIANLRVKR